MTGLMLDELSGFGPVGLPDEVPDLALGVTEPCKRAQILNVGKQHCRPLDGLCPFAVGHMARCLGAIKRYLLVRAVTKWFVSRVTAAAESILLWRWIILSGSVIQGFALGIRFDPFFAEWHTTAHEVRAILCHFDLRVSVFFMVSSLFDGQYPTVKR